MSMVRKITSFLIALVVLFSTLSFTIDMHYCGDILVDTAIFHKADTCGMYMNNSELASVKKKCCHDKQINIDGQDEMQLSPDNIYFLQQLLITSFEYSYSNFFVSVDKDLTFYSKHVIWLVVKQLYKLDESYLI
jgi:hypothetical protein